MLANENLEHPQSPEATAEKSVESSANYSGNWTEAQTERMTSDDFRAKFEAFITRGARELRQNRTEVPEGVVSLERGPTQAEYESRIVGFQALLDQVTTKIGYVDASEWDKKPTSLGAARYDTEGSDVVLFRDAVKDGELLNARQKDIIAAHEMYHGMISPEGANVAEVRSAFDGTVVTEELRRLEFAAADVVRPSYSYMLKSSELTARMAQVKNYFGMKGAEAFTSEHLEYARAHYVADTGLDNNMTLFFRMAKPDQFIRLMNELPI